jgi:hypothetical protein
MRAYMAKKHETRFGPGRMASFEEWDDLVRQTVCWLASLQQAGAIPVGLDDDKVYPELADPMDAVNAAVSHDPVRERHGVLLLEVAKAFGYGENGNAGPMFTVKELVSASDPVSNAGLGSYSLEDDDEAALYEALVDVGGNATTRRINKNSLGKYLAKNKDRIVNGLCLRRGPDRQRYATWWVERLAGESSEFSEFLDTMVGSKGWAEFKAVPQTVAKAKVPKVKAPKAKN